MHYSHLTGLRNQFLAVDKHGPQKGCLYQDLAEDLRNAHAASSGCHTRLIQFSLNVRLVCLKLMKTIQDAEATVYNLTESCP